MQTTVTIAMRTATPQEAAAPFTVSRVSAAAHIATVETPSSQANRCAVDIMVASPLPAACTAAQGECQPLRSRADTSFAAISAAEAPWGSFRCQVWRQDD